MDLVLTEKIKPEFRKIYGKVLNSLSKIEFSGKLVVVGDMVSYEALVLGIKPDILVYDGIIGRKKTSKKMLKKIEKYKAKKIVVKNPPRCISKKLLEVVSKVLDDKGRFKIFVRGEEDLATFAFALKSRIGTNIVYGLPNKGIAFIKVDKKIKDKCKELLKKMRARSSAW
ncbi:MAG: DUF359 domain-containing protein [Candidatus Aenigmatarchaeota archaeon]